MSDSFDVMATLAGLMTTFVYPNGTSEPSVTGNDIICYPGWPTQSVLDNDLRATKSHVSVYCLPGGQNTTRYPPRNQRISATPATLNWAVIGITATLSGTVSTPQNVAIIVDNVAYAYAVQATDTLTSIAAALAALIAVNRPCTSTGAVISIPDARTIVARVGTVSTVAAEWSRQKEAYQITVWCSTPANRKTIMGAIRAGLAQKHFIQMPDGYGARVRYRNGTPNDETQKALLYRYDLFYEVEYATTVTSTVPQAIVWTVNVYGGSSVPTVAPSITFNF
ncbi:hypothetical protein PQR71_39850 [Paraburkholderia fungorum]|uniref:hypothetical protein n=1 Tax=Paraburkholderia fungorum TaxID=134537 RepID=UPI0038BD724A